MAKSIAAVLPHDEPFFVGFFGELKGIYAGTAAQYSWFASAAAAVCAKHFSIKLANIMSVAAAIVCTGLYVSFAGLLFSDISERNNDYSDTFDFRRG